MGDKFPTNNGSYGFETRDMHKTAQERLEKLKPLLELTSERLRKFGAPVDNEARIDINFFAKIKKYDPQIIEADLAEVIRKEKEYRDKDAADELMARNMGELLEVTKTILFNKHWFDIQGRNNFVALRTSKFDDYSSGIDELVFDTSSFKPLAVIDMTTTSKQVGAGSRHMRYGLKWERKGFVPADSLEKLPVFVVRIQNEQVLTLAREVLSGKLSPESQSMEKTILTAFKKQCVDGKKNFDKDTVALYDEAYKNFDSIEKTMAMYAK